MNRRTFLASTAGIALAHGCSSTDAAAVTSIASLTIEPSGWLIADVTINGATYPMVLDTGARVTTLGMELIAALSIAPTGERATLTGAGGSIEEDVYQLREVAFADVSASAVRAFSLSQPLGASRAMGVLSTSMFLGKRLELNLDPAEARVTSDPHRERLDSGVPVDLRNEMFVLAPGALAGQAITVVIDTGAQHSIANTRVLSAMGVAEDDPRLAVVGHARGASGPISLKAMDVGALSVAGYDFAQGRLGFGDLPVFGALGIAETPALILGMDRMRRLQSITIDYSEPSILLR